MIKINSRLILIGLLTNLFGQTIQIMSPEPESPIAGKDVLIAASFYGMENLDPADVFLSIDGKDVTTNAFIDEDMVTYLIPLIDPGEHKVYINTKGAEGRAPETVTWLFRVVEEKEIQPKVAFSGKLTSGMTYDRIDEEELGVSQIGLNIQGSAYGWLKFKSDVKLTSEENALIQPRNRYGLTLELGRYANLRYGDTNPIFTYLTLNGKRVRGLDLQLNWRFLNFHFIKGEINRVVQGGTEIGESHSLKKIWQEVDSTTTDTMTYVVIDRKGYTFKQNIIAGRLGFGKGEKFRLGFSLLKIRDDINSINSNLKDAMIEISDNTFSNVGLDSGNVTTFSRLMNLNSSDNFIVNLEDKSDWTGSAPQDNLVVGSDIGVYFDHKRILLEGEFAISLLNRNIWEGAISLAGLDTLLDDTTDNFLAEKFDLDAIPYDPKDFSNWFIINQNMVPLTPIDISVFSDTSEISLGEAILSMPSLAFKTRAALNYFGNFFTLEYSQIGPEYTSLANPYLFKDNRVFAVSDKIRLFKNRLLLTGAYEHQDNDILTTVKNVKTQDTYSAGINIIPGPGLPSLNLNFRTLDRSNGITAIDSLFNTSDTSLSFSDSREKTRTKNMMATVTHRLQVFGRSHDLIVTFVNLEKIDQINNGRELDTNFVDPGLLSRVINFSVNTSYSIPLRTSFSITSNVNEFNIGANESAEQKFIMANLDGEYGLNKQKIILQGGINYAQGSGQVEFNWVGLKAGARVSIIKNLSLYALSEIRAKKANNIRKNTIIGRVNLTYSF